VFNLSPRDMNRLALQSRLLGAQALGLENVLVVQGDAIAERDPFSAVADYTATGLIAAIRELNKGVDLRGTKLRGATDFCVGASIDLARPFEAETRLTQRKLAAGAQFFVTQPVWDLAVLDAFLQEYRRQTGESLTTPVFTGLQILIADGVLFSNVPEEARAELAAGRDGVEMALETYAGFRSAGLDAIYLVSPILRGGARDYDAAARFLAAV
jgi:homocysteine S-methyltransferase